MYSFFNVDNYRKNTVYNKKSKKPIECKKNYLKT